MAREVEFQGFVGDINREGANQRTVLEYVRGAALFLDIDAKFFVRFLCHALLVA
jgi:hypothetical protein